MEKIKLTCCRTRPGQHGHRGHLKEKSICKSWTGRRWDAIEHTNMLGTNEILSIRKVSRNGKLDAILVPGAPSVTREISILVAHAFLKDLEPLSVTLVRVRSSRSLGHVDKSRPGMLHGSTNGEFHGQLGPSLDLGGSSLAGEGECAFVAAEIELVGSHIVTDVVPFRRVVLCITGVGADVLHAVRFLAVYDENVEEVVSGDEGHQGRERSE